MEREEQVAVTPNMLRAAGWSVAVHNDYRLNGNQQTFWLWTHPNGNFVKGEGSSDQEALEQCAAALATLPDPATIRRQAIEGCIGICRDAVDNAGDEAELRMAEGTLSAILELADQPAAEKPNEATEAMIEAAVKLVEEDEGGPRSGNEEFVAAIYAAMEAARLAEGAGKKERG